jgi:predicted nuclease of predicted toxin-antitoxin system
MKILIDMNLSPEWVPVLEAENIEAAHWSSIGKPDAPDEEIMRFARENGYAIFTHDLDFGTLLALTQATSPSVFQVRTQDIFPENMSKTVISILQKYQTQIEQGALIVSDKARERVRILPLQKSDK